MIPTEELHKSKTNDHKGAVESLENKGGIQDLIALLVISNLCQNLANNFEYSDPEAKADDAKETLAYVDRLLETKSMVYGHVRVSVSVTLVIVYSPSSIGEECEPNKNSKLDKENNQVEKPGKGSNSRRLKTFFIFHLEFGLQVHCARAGVHTVSVTLETVPAD